LILGLDSKIDSSNVDYQKFRLSLVLIT